MKAKNFGAEEMVQNELVTAELCYCKWLCCCKNEHVLKPEFKLFFIISKKGAGRKMGTEGQG